MYYTYVRANTSQVKWIASVTQTFPKGCFSTSWQYRLEYSNCWRNEFLLEIIAFSVAFCDFVDALKKIFRKFQTFRGSLTRMSKHLKLEFSQTLISQSISGVQKFLWQRAQTTDTKLSATKKFFRHISSTLDAVWRILFLNLAHWMQYSYFSSTLRWWVRPKEKRSSSCKHARWCHELMFWEKVCHLSSSISKCVLNLCVT